MPGTISYTQGQVIGSGKGQLAVVHKQADSALPLKIALASVSQLSY